MTNNEFRNARIGVFILAFILLFCIAFYFFASMFTSMGYDAFVQAVDTVTVKNSPVIVIDAGHGGEDPGAVDNGAVEKDINLSIALYLGQLCTAGDLEAKQTRESDVLLYGDGEESRKKHFDLLNRKLVAESYGSEAVFISLHSNKFFDSKYWGLQTFYSENDPDSALLAEYIQQNAVILTPENTRKTKPGGSGIYLLENLMIPSVLVECGFLSNRQEAKRLADPMYQRQVALSIYCGLCDFLKEANDEN